MRAGDKVMRRLGAGVNRRRRRCAEVAGAVGEYGRVGPATWLVSAAGGVVSPGPACARAFA